MNNLNVLVVGMTGSGKTTLARYMLSLTPRAFVFDPMDDYADGAVYYTFAEAFDFYERCVDLGLDFHIIYRGDRDSYAAWLDVLWQSQGALNLPPLGVFLEESSWYSTSHVIPPELDQIYTKGRRHRISIVTVTQRDTQINPIIRANSAVWVSMRQRKFSSDVQATFTSSDLDKIQNLETYSPSVKGAPVEGKHYVPDNPRFPLFETWARLMTTEGADKGVRDVSENALPASRVSPNAPASR